MKTLYLYEELTLHWSVFTVFVNNNLGSRQAVYLDDPLVHTCFAIVSFGLGSLCC